LNGWLDLFRYVELGGLGKQNWFLVGTTAVALK